MLAGMVKAPGFAATCALTLDSILRTPSHSRKASAVLSIVVSRMKVDL
jgi:hypothetical protein